MNFRQIEVFRSVMLSGSMTTAAERLRTSQPNVSRVIAAFQREVGFRLFQRIGYRLVPTPEAEALLKEVERSFVGIESIREAATSIRAVGTGGMRIAVSPALGIGVMPQAVARFRKQHPDGRVSVFTGDSPTVAKWVASGHCDLGIASYSSEAPGLKFRLLRRRPAVCVVPAGHNLASRRRVQTRDLDGEVFISLPYSDHTRQRIDALFNPDRRRLELETPHAATICMMVANGVGVSIVNPFLVGAWKPANLRVLEFIPSVEFSCLSVHAENRPLQEFAAKFLELVEQVV